MSDSNWGKGVINGIGWGQLATNDIGAGSIYSVSHSGETALIGVSAAFSYDKSSYNQGEANPTPTITGTTGGTFSGTSGLVFVSTSTGQIDLSASSVASHVVTYTVGGVSADFSLSVTAAPFANQFSFEFDGFDEGFTIGNPTELQLTNNISISGWFKTSSTLIMNLFTKRASGINNWAVYMQSGKIYFWVSVNGSSIPVQVNSAGTLNDGDWHFFAGVRDGTSLKLYIDNLSPVTGTVASGSLGNPNGTIMIAETAVNSFRFNGNLDELAIFDYGLSEDNIDTIYGTGQPSSLSTLSPVAFYRMGDEATFNSATGVWTLTDQGSGGNNATSNNMEEADRKADTP